MNAFQLLALLLGCCGLTCAAIYQKCKWMIADFEAGMRHAMQCAFCDLKLGSDR